VDDVGGGLVAQPLKDTEDKGAVSAHVVAAGESELSLLLHGLALFGIEREPAFEEVDGALEGIVFDDAAAVGFDLRGDVDLVGDKDGATAGEGLGNCDAEVLLASLTAKAPHLASPLSMPGQWTRWERPAWSTMGCRSFRMPVASGPAMMR
jgi:hypothetical protein